MSINWLFIFVPVAAVLEHVAPQAYTWVFFAACLAIIPIAHLIVESTEHISQRTGDAIGGLLNATFGNAPELIIATVALKAGLFDMVRASLIGAILANLLLALGIAFLLGGLRYHSQEYNPAASRIYSTMMLTAVISLVVPSTFSRFLAAQAAPRDEQMLNLGMAVVLLIAYGLYLLFLLKTHPEFFSSAAASAEPQEHQSAGEQWPVTKAVASLIIASVLAAWMSEILVGAAEGTGKALGMSQTFIGIVFLAVVGGAAESGSAIAMARKDKMDLTVAIALGSCIQIALFVAPVLVFASYFVAPEPLELSFGRAELGAMFLAILIGAMVSGDGRSNWYKGVQLTTVYVILAFLFYFMPEAGPQ
jgi:Ca2+:H+ antiporter